MVKVAVFENGFTAIGHADYSEYGTDIVCSAISAITQTALAGLIFYNDAVADIHEGNMSVHIAKPDDKSKIILNTMLLGLKEIEEVYPNHIKVKGEI